MLIADVFPFAGETALFSNVVSHNIAVRPVRMAGSGNAASFKAEGPEVRFTCQFEVLTPSTNGERQAQLGTCKLPDGSTLPVLVGDERGTLAPDGAIHVFAGLRSDPCRFQKNPFLECLPVPMPRRARGALSKVPR